jgi:hypothetical protein
VTYSPVPFERQLISDGEGAIVVGKLGLFCHACFADPPAGRPTPGLTKEVERVLASA